MLNQFYCTKILSSIIQNFAVSDLVHQTIFAKTGFFLLQKCIPIKRYPLYYWRPSYNTTRKTKRCLQCLLLSAAVYTIGRYSYYEYCCCMILTKLLNKEIAILASNATSLVLVRNVVNPLLKPVRNKVTLLTNRSQISVCS